MTRRLTFGKKFFYKTLLNLIEWCNVVRIYIEFSLCNFSFSYSSGNGKKEKKKNSFAHFFALDGIKKYVYEATLNLIHENRGTWGFMQARTTPLQRKYLWLEGT